MKKPTIVIIAGGENSRFFPLNKQTHKGFISLLGEPIISRALKNLKKYDFKKVILVVSPKDYDGKGFSKYLKENDFGLNIQVVLQKQPTGMGGALLLAKQFLSNDDFILTSPYYFNMGEKAKLLIEKKQTSNANCVLFGTLTTTPNLYGILKLDPKNRTRVLGITEKPKTNKNTTTFKVDSFYLLNSDFLKELEQAKKENYSLENTITRYATKAKITWIENTKSIKSIKYPWHLFNIFIQIIKNTKTSIDKSAQISKTAVINNDYGPVIIERGARIGEFTKISGPCYIGRDCFVGDYSFIRGSSLEENTVVGARTEIVRSILFEETSIHSGYLSDSILGRRTQIGAGLITANKRFDRKNILVQISNANKKNIDSQKKALGIITGNNVQIGIRVSTMPGILIGQNSIIYPEINLVKNVDEDQVIKE